MSDLMNFLAGVISEVLATIVWGGIQGYKVLQGRDLKLRPPGLYPTLRSIFDTTLRIVL